MADSFTVCLRQTGAMNTTPLPSQNKADYLFFYRTAHPFSNFHPSPFVVDEQLFQTSEQYLMYLKAVHFGDDHAAEQILVARTPAECKRWGRRVKGFDEAEWLRVREEIALQVLRAKFGLNKKMREALLATGQKILVEASPTDRIWGIGYSESDAWENRFQWGENLLGRTLMVVRAELSTF